MKKQNGKEAVLAHMRRTFQEVLRCVGSNDLSEEWFDYVRYKCEGAINILQLSVHVYNIPATFIDQAGDVLRILEDAREEVQQGGFSNTAQLGNILLVLQEDQPSTFQKKFLKCLSKTNLRLVPWQEC